MFQGRIGLEWLWEGEDRRLVPAESRPWSLSLILRWLQAERGAHTGENSGPGPSPATWCLHLHRCFHLRGEFSELLTPSGKPVHHLIVLLDWGSWCDRKVLARKSGRKGRTGKRGKGLDVRRGEMRGEHT